jgi:hypothetical protein
VRRTPATEQLDGVLQLGKNARAAMFNQFMRSNSFPDRISGFPSLLEFSRTFAQWPKTARAILGPEQRLRLLQSIIRFTLGALLLVPIIAVFLLFCAVAVITDKAERARW